MRALACLLASLSFAASACSRTAVHPPLVLDAGASDALVSRVPVPLARASIDAVMVVDRSGSMTRPMDPRDPDGPSRWEALIAALDVAIDVLDPEVRLGAELFPDERLNGDDDRARFCASSPELTLPPTFDGGARLVERMQSGPPPRGGTPTAAAIVAAHEALRISSSSRRAMILVTDGAPNCSVDPPSECVCSTHPDECRADPLGLLCLDDEGALSAIDTALADGIPVVVIGIDDPARPELAAILDRMAIAGGRPRPEGSPHRYHSARSPAELAAALTAISSGLAECTFVPAGTLGPIGSVVSIEVGGRAVPPSPIDGWTPSALLPDAIDLHGPACEAALRSERPIIAYLDAAITEELTGPPITEHFVSSP